MKNDPVQGIFFKQEPTLLRQKADERAQSVPVENNKAARVFFERVRSVKPTFSRPTIIRISKKSK